MSNKAYVGATGLLATAVTLLFASAAQAETCPNEMAYGERREVSAEELARAPLRLPIPAGGDLNLSDCRRVPGTGYITEQPDLSLRITSNPTGRRLDFRVESQCDAVMLLNSPSREWRFDDDSNGNLDPAIVVNSAAAGWWDVWLGRFGTEPGSCPAELVVRALPATVRTSAAPGNLRTSSYRK